jgi:hypothetical protein
MYFKNNRFKEVLFGMTCKVPKHQGQRSCHRVPGIRRQNPKDIYTIDVSPELISRVSEEVKKLAGEWRGRPLEPFYPVVFLDALRVNIRDGGTVVKKSVYLALAIRMDGQKELGETKFRTGCGLNKTRGRSFGRAS